MIEGLPVLDSHIHLDPMGSNRHAVRRFRDCGGTHLIVVHKPYHHINIHGIGDYISSFETTVGMCEMAGKEGVKSWCVVGPYPGELPMLARTLGFEAAVDLQDKAVDAAINMVRENKALGIGEVGRVHFKVEDRVQEACDDLLHHIFREARGLDCPVVLHTESYHSNPELMRHLARMIDKAGFSRKRVVKHYSGPDLIEPKDNLGISISLQCRKVTLRQLLGSDQVHLLETDFIDDLDRPNVVMPPETVPKKVQWAYGQGLLDHERHARLMIEQPRSVLNIETDE
ncbi:MAG: TatD family hydrolase [Candidatus Thermoplasmatota archaeon]|nr:TatD family hydrolase [Candidatus Thermoplasmatota archaeon]